MIEAGHCCLVGRHHGCFIIFTKMRESVLYSHTHPPNHTGELSSPVNVSFCGRTHTIQCSLYVKKCSVRTNTTAAFLRHSSWSVLSSSLFPPTSPLSLMPSSNSSLLPPPSSSPSSFPSFRSLLSSPSPSSSSFLSSSPSSRRSSPSPSLPMLSSSSSPSSLPSIAPLQCKETNSDIDMSLTPTTPDDFNEEGTLPLIEGLTKTSFWESTTVARILLLLVPVFWGTYGPAVRYVYEQPYPPSASVLTLARKALSLFFFFCFLPLETSTNLPENSTKGLGSQEQDFVEMDKGKLFTVNQLPGFLTEFLGIEWFAAIELGLWTFLGTACQTDGLENTTATRAGFLLQIVTVLVPLLSTFSGVTVKPKTWAATVLALLGVTSMSVQLQPDASVLLSWSALLSSFNLSRGDLEILLAAFFYALCTVRLGNYAAKTQAVALSTNLMVVSTILAASWVLFDHTGTLSMGLHLLSSPNTVLAIIFSALVPGTLASLGQTIGQKTISPAEAQVYFSLQPFYSAIFAAVILRENIDNTTWVAGTVLVVAAFIASFDTAEEVQG